MFTIYAENFPPTINSYPECHKVVTHAAAKVVGQTRASLPQKTMVAEDFSYFLHARPGEILVPLVTTTTSTTIRSTTSPTVLLLYYNCANMTAPP